MCGGRVNIWGGGAVLVGKRLGLGLGEVEVERKRKKGKKIQQKEKMFFFSFDLKIPVRKKLTSKKKDELVLNKHEQNQMKEEKTILSPWRELNPTSLVLVRLVNHYTTRTNHTGNAAS